MAEAFGPVSLPLPGPFGGQPPQVFDMLPQQPQALIELLALQSRR
jgi:hypothetical protein